jgi:hypothetical protein
MALFPRFNRKVFGVLAIVCGSICLLGAGGWGVYSYHFSSTALRVVGQIVKNVERHDDHGDYYYPVFRYTDRNGLAHTVSSNTGSFPATHQIGDAVTVLYLPGAESDAQLGDWFEIWGVPTVLAILGIVYLPMGIVMCYWPQITKRWRS